MQKFLKSFLRPSKPTRKGSKKGACRLLLEKLEDRECPATYTWIGTGVGSGALWDNRANWSTAVGNPAIQNLAPGSSIDLVFGGATGQNTNTTDNLPRIAFNSIVVDTNYASKITISSTLTTNELVMSGGANSVLQGSTKTSVLSNLSTVNVTNAFFFGGGQLLFLNMTLGAAAQNPESVSTINGATGKTITGTTITNFGTLNWWGGNIGDNSAYTTTIANKSGATFSINAPGSAWTEMGTGQLSIANSGTLTMESGAGNTTMLNGAGITNAGIFNVSSGTLQVTAPDSFTGRGLSSVAQTSFAATTIIESGAVLSLGGGKRGRARLFADDLSGVKIC